jgi:hypothetical protein
MTRRQVYLDISAMSGGGGLRPDGSATPYFDIDVMLDILTNRKMNLVLDPHSGKSSRWAIQCALYSAFGWDGKAEAKPYNIEKLRAIAATMDYIPPMQTHSIIVVGKHDNCNKPHPGDDD